MSNIGFSKTSFDLLKALEANNNKAWMDHNRDAVKEHLQDPFAFMLECISRELSDNDLPLSGNKKTMFRLHRDIRFSKDKRPYNRHVSGILTPSGMKNEQDGLVYVRLERGNSFLGAGYYAMKAKDLAPKRDKILEQSERFKTIIEDLEGHGLSFSFESSLTSMPRGYSEYADHELAPFIKLKSLIVRQDVKKTDWYTDNIVRQVTLFAKHCTPMIEFFRSV